MCGVAACRQHEHATYVNVCRYLGTYVRLQSGSAKNRHKPCSSTTMRGIGSSGGGRFDLLSPFRRKPRHDVEQFRFLYATLLEQIEPPPPPPPLPPSSPPQSPSLRPVAAPVDDDADDDEAREQRPQQQQPPEEGSSQEAAVLIDNNDGGRDDPSRYTNDGNFRRLRVRRRPTTKASFPSPSRAKPYSLTEESAWRVLAATPNPWKEGNCADTALAVRDDESVAVLAGARAKESKVVDIIYQIGETITQACDDEVWAYFCDKNILSLLVDIAKAKPEESGDSVFCGVVFSPKVKAQVLQTLTEILSNADGDDTSLYFLLSSNHINEAVSFFVPLHQWTLHALEEMLPHYCILLRNLTRRLLDKPQLVQFFVGGHHEESTAKQQCCFPLFHSAVHVLSSTFAQSDAFVYETTLGVVLNLPQIPSEGIRSAIAGAIRDQDLLLSHLCQRLTARYRHIARLTVGISSGDPARSKAIGRELAHLHEMFQVMNDVLWCGIRPLNVRFCEYLLRVLFENILPNLLLCQDKDIGTDGTSSNKDSRKIPPDDPLICEEEAHCIASLVFLNQLFLTLEYAPLLKMCAVAVFHPLSPKDSFAKETLNGGNLESDYFVLQSALNAILNLNDSTAATDEETSNTHENLYRAVLYAMIRGDRGYRRFIPAAILLQGLFDSQLEVSFLASLHIVNDKSEATEEERNEGQYSEFQDGIGHFFSRNQRPSETASIALECAGALSLSFISHLIVAWTSNGTNFERFHNRFTSSPLVTAISTARSQYAAKAKTISKATELSDIFIELVELELSRRYVAIPGENDTKVFVCDLNANDCHHFQSNPEILVRTLRDPGSNEVEEAKFIIRALFYLRSLGRVLIETDQNHSSCIGPQSIGLRWTEDSFFEVRTSEVMEDDYIELVGREERPQIGTELDIRGRTFFYCVPSLPDINSSYSSLSDQKRRLSQDLMRMATTGQQEELLLVLDPTDLFVLKPNLSNGACNRGVILCHAPIGAVIAAVPERELLHIAIRQTEESFFVKNGNMSLKFDSIGTSRIAEQYLGRCRSALSTKKMANIESILNSCLEDLFVPTGD